MSLSCIGAEAASRRLVTLNTMSTIPTATTTATTDPTAVAAMTVDAEAESDSASTGAKPCWAAANENDVKKAWLQMLPVMPAITICSIH